MDLIPKVECRRCGTEYSSLQSQCPKCGTRKMKQTRRAPGTTSGSVAGTYANEQAQVNARWQMTFAAILVVAVILAMIVLISTSLSTAPGGSNAGNQGGTGNQVEDTSPSPTVTPTPTPTPTPKAVTSINLFYGTDTTPKTEFTAAIGDKTYLKATVYPLNLVDVATEVTYTSSDESVCKVKATETGCEIENVGTGSCQIIADCYGKTAVVTVYGRESW